MVLVLTWILIGGESGFRFRADLFLRLSLQCGLPLQPALHVEVHLALGHERLGLLTQLRQLALLLDLRPRHEHVQVRAVVGVAVAGVLTLITLPGAALALVVLGLAIGHLALVRVPERVVAPPEDGVGRVDIRGTLRLVHSIPGLLALVAFSQKNGALDGQIAAFFVMVVAAAEVVVGLAIIVTIFRTRRSASIDDANLLKF